MSKDTEKQKSEDQSKPQADKGPVLTEQTIPRAQNPALFIAIVAMVLVLGLIVGVYKQDTTIVDVDAPKPQIASRVDEDPAALRNIPMMNVIKETTSQRRAAASEQAEAAPACNYTHLVGRQYDESVAEMIKDAGNSERPLRILKPGDAYTQDFAPNRVNINLDEAGVITRIWCG